MDTSITNKRTKSVYESFNEEKLEFELFSPIEETVEITLDEYKQGKAADKLTYLLEAYNCEYQLLNLTEQEYKNRIISGSFYFCLGLMFGYDFLIMEDFYFLSVGAFALNILSGYKIIDSLKTLHMCKERKEEVAEISKEVKKLKACEQLIK